MLQNTRVAHETIMHEITNAPWKTTVSGRVAHTEVRQRVEGQKRPTGLDLTRRDRPREHRVQAIAVEAQLRMQHDAAGGGGEGVHAHDLRRARPQLQRLQLEAEEDWGLVVAQDEVDALGDEPAPALPESERCTCMHFNSPTVRFQSSEHGHSHQL